jgi:hypothetical protein
MSWPAKSAVALAVALAAVTGSANAGRACEEQSAPPEDVAQAFDNASKLSDMLDATGQRVLILARRGQNLEKYGVRYSHAAYAVKRDGAWSIHHELNQCGTDRSGLFVQGLAEFLLDASFSREVAIVAPPEWLQDRLAQLLASHDEQNRMHHQRYSAVAYPFALKYQNSNGWVLETYARASSDTLLATRAEAQSWLKREGYTPSRLHLGTLTRLGGRMFKANVAFDDHPPELRWKGTITASTADSLLRFVAREGLAQPGCAHGTFPATVCVVPPAR